MLTVSYLTHVMQTAYDLTAAPAPSHFTAHDCVAYNRGCYDLAGDLIQAAWAEEIEEEAEDEDWTWPAADEFAREWDKATPNFERIAKLIVAESLKV